MERSERTLTPDPELNQPVKKGLTNEDIDVIVEGLRSLLLIGFTFWRMIKDRKK